MAAATDVVAAVEVEENFEDSSMVINFERRRRLSTVPIEYKQRAAFNAHSVIRGH